jgi:signal transduction histidine kinase
VEVIVAPTKYEEYVEIQIVDDGPGIPDEERLVATKPEETSPLNHGTGLGLWAASTIVRSFEGSFRIEDNDPRGSIVSMTLPRAGVRAASG